MVPAEDEEVLRVLDFVGQQQANCFQRLLSTVHVVSKEQVVGFRREASVLKEPQQIIVLAVDVT